VAKQSKRYSFFIQCLIIAFLVQGVWRAAGFYQKGDVRNI